MGQPYITATVARGTAHAVQSHCHIDEELHINRQAGFLINFFYNGIVSGHPGAGPLCWGLGDRNSNFEFKTYFGAFSVFYHRRVIHRYHALFLSTCHVLISLSVSAPLPSMRYLVFFFFKSQTWLVKFAWTGLVAQHCTSQLEVVQRSKTQQNTPNNYLIVRRHTFHVILSSLGSNWKKNAL